MSELEWSKTKTVFASDSSLTGAGGVNYERNTYFTLAFQEPYRNYKIHVLEMLTLILCCKVWGQYWAGRKIQALCDNQCRVIAVNKGSSKDLHMQACIRELFILHMYIALF